jgi:hypothetical protein
VTLDHACRQCRPFRALPCEFVKSQIMNAHLPITLSQAS